MRPSLDLGDQPNQNDGDSSESSSGPNWWTREEQAKFLDANLLAQSLPRSSEFPLEDNFAKRKSISEVLLKTEDGTPVIHKRLIWPGSGIQVTPESTVSFHLSAFVEDDLLIPFDCSVMRKKPFLARLDTSPLLTGVYYALLSMKVGEKSEFIVAADLAYGKQGAPPRIPPNDEVLFIISVKKVHLEGSIGRYLMLTLDEQAALPADEVISVVNSEKQSGNNYYNSGKYPEALSRYKRALKFLSDCIYPEGEQGKVIDDILSKLLTNAANTALQLDSHTDCIKFCKKALQLNENNVKALYFAGTSYLRLGKLKESKQMLTQAHKIHPCRDVIEMIAELAKQERLDEEESKQLAKLMARALDLPGRH